jgi:hypothetical protein
MIRGYEGRASWGPDVLLAGHDQEFLEEGESRSTAWAMRVFRSI